MEASKGRQDSLHDVGFCALQIEFRTPSLAICRFGFFGPITLSQRIRVFQHFERTLAAAATPVAELLLQNSSSRDFAMSFGSKQKYFLYTVSSKKLSHTLSLPPPPAATSAANSFSGAGVSSGAAPISSPLLASMANPKAAQAMKSIVLDGEGGARTRGPAAALIGGGGVGKRHRRHGSVSHSKRNSSESDGSQSCALAGVGLSFGEALRRASNNNSPDLLQYAEDRLKLLRKHTLYRAPGAPSCREVSRCMLYQCALTWSLPTLEVANSVLQHFVKVRCAEGFVVVSSNAGAQSFSIFPLLTNFTSYVFTRQAK